MYGTAKLSISFFADMLVEMLRRRPITYLGKRKASFLVDLTLSDRLAGHVHSELVLVHKGVEEVLDE